MPSNFRTDFFGDCPTEMAIGDDRAGYRQARVDSLTEDPHSFVKVYERPELEAARLNDNANVACRRKAVDREHAQGRWAIQNDGGVVGEVRVSQACLEDVLATSFRDELCFAT